MEDGALAEESDPKADDESDDPVEDCSDIEVPSHPLEPSTPTGVAGRFATLLGVQRSAGRGHGEPTSPGPGDDAIGATQPPQHVGETGQDVPASTNAGLLLTQALEDIMASVSGHDRGDQSTDVPEFALPADSRGDAGQVEEAGLLEGMEDPTGPQVEVEAATERAERGEEVGAEAEAAAEAEAEMEAGRPEAARAESKRADEGGVDAAGVDSEDSEAELPAFLSGRPGARPQTQGQLQPLPEEPWMSRPDTERELWERVRPRGLRQEAARLQALRLPAAALGRIMRLNPGLQMRSVEALEVVNLSTLLLIQAVARAAARGKLAGQHVNFEDVRAVCSSVAELQFLHPLSCTLDPSARVMYRDSSNHTSHSPAGAAAAAPAAGNQGVKLREAAVGEGSEQHPGESPQLQQTEDQRKGVKRRAASSGPKTSGKASRTGLSAGRTGLAASAAGPSIATFFSKVTAAVD